ncbi:hypothetical protein [Legionella sp. km772]|uniref:hypothetical protein n=1 Tax=Legionella sp. km772 TaxID=2498111 RepID=UPI000F8DD0E3|nr:hypothetical protein [Legionella sp. km772]RUR12080.1 hypothetical protein ELY15_06185 [Legionella sp. km772]
MNNKAFQNIFSVRILLLISLPVLISACVNLSGTRNNYTKTHSVVVEDKHAKYKGEVHTMLGGLGLFSKGMITLRDSVAARYDIPAYNNIWYNAGDVTRVIADNYHQQKDPRPIILVGHSLGANEQIKVARNLNKLNIPVALLITVDAVSQTIVPPNVHEAVNFYKSGYVPMFSGLKLRAVDPAKTHIENIDVTKLKGVGVNHFTIDKNPTVQEMILEKIKKVVVNGKRKNA